MTASLNNLSDFALSTLVLNNISITPTSLTSTAQFGTSLQAYNALQSALGYYFGSVGIANRGIVIEQLSEIHFNVEVDTQFGLHGNAAVAFNKQVAANYTYSANPANTAGAIATSCVVVETIVTLDGSTSTFLSGKTLTYLWSIASKPVENIAGTASETAAKSTFVPDVAATYLVSLKVNDGTYDAVPAQVSISADSFTCPPPAAPMQLGTASMSRSSGRNSKLLTLVQIDCAAPELAA